MTHAGLDDTSPEAAAVQLELMRQAGPGGRFRACLGLSRSMIAVSRAALRRSRPELGETELLIEWVSIHYGSVLADGLRRRLGIAG